MGSNRGLLGISVLLLGVMVQPSWAVSEEDINKAVARGVKYLRSLQGADGRWVWAQADTGSTALGALTLLECDVPANDPSIEKAAEALRQEALKVTHTYSLSLMILFFDRLGDPADIPLIESLMVRLMAGQQGDGGWSYQCPPIGDAEVNRLTALLRNRNQLRGQLSLPKPGAKKRLNELPREIQQQVAQVQRFGGGGGGGMLALNNSDNSNTQFATLAMWIGRKHGLPVDAALARLDNRFRRTQNANGTWAYTMSMAPPGVPPGVAIVDVPTPQMTCAGVLAIAVAHGVANDPELGGRGTDLSRDAVLQRGLAALETAVGEPGGEVPRLGQGQGKVYYALWSIERVCVALDLNRLGKKDWYGWGAEILLANQGGDGSWQGEYAQGGVDTCFALLFLRRANLARDLSANLRGRMKEITIRGGIGKIPRVTDKEQKRTEDPRPKDPPKMKPIPERAENLEAAKLSDELLEAGAANRETVLKRLRDSKGADFTEALALSIPRLTGEERQKTRDALQVRLTRMTARTLGEYLKDTDPEIRAAAALATAVKGLKEQVPQLIDQLNDTDPYVVRAAATALRELTKEDHGPAPGASREDHEKAVLGWKKWWMDNRPR